MEVTMRFATIAWPLASATLLATVLAASSGAQTAGAGAAPAAGPAPNGAAAPTENQAQARAILMRMADYIARAPAFSVSMITSYDSVQASGQKIEFGERRKLVLGRPDHLRAEAEHSDGSRTAAVFTGSQLVLIDATNKVYATERQPGGLDESILYVVSDLGMRFPLAMLLMSRLPAEFEKRVRSIEYVEKTNLLGTPSHHLAARGDTVDFQVWVADGPQPVPLRIVLTYKDAPGEPEYRAQFTDWNMTPAITDATFRADLPAGSQKILFAAQLKAARARGPGGKQ
jgi:hypothetical protein